MEEVEEATKTRQEIVSGGVGTRGLLRTEWAGERGEKSPGEESPQPPGPVFVAR